MLAGLNELNNVEKTELDKKRANFTPREQEENTTPAKKPSARTDEKEEGGGSGWTATVVIVAALAVAGCMFVARRAMTKP